MNFKTSTLIILLAIFVLPFQSVAGENGLLWRISGNGLAQPSYLFGTHHLAPVSFLETVSGLSEAFESTEQVVGEVDASNPMAVIKLQIQMLQRATMPPGITYGQLLSPEDFALLENKLRDLTGRSLRELGGLKPAMLSTIISIAWMQRYFPEMTGEMSIDEYFQHKAVARSRPVRALDTAESQLYSMFDVSSIERQAKLLMCRIHNAEAEAGRELIHRMNELYYAFDLKGLYALYVEYQLADAGAGTCPPTEEELNAATINRHLRCIDRLSAIIQEKSSFIAVGALHLVGEYGLIEGLRRRGYTVEAVR